MIVDDLHNFDKYIPLNKKFVKVKEFLQTNELNNMHSGSYNIEGRDIYVNIDEYMTKTVTESYPEAHKNYIDIQLIISGHEKIGYGNVETAKTVIEYSHERDIEFFTAECEYIKAFSGRFFIFYPQDLHHPCITDCVQSKIKKAVFKIKL